MIAGPNGAEKTLLREIRVKVERRRDFSFETTLSGRSYVRLLKELRSNGWTIVLFYLWIPSAEFSRLRVEQRVEEGGHDISDEAILRRYSRTVSNFLNVFSPLCDEVFCYDNSTAEFVSVFSMVSDKKGVLDAKRYQLILESCYEE